MTERFYGCSPNGQFPMTMLQAEENMMVAYAFASALTIAQVIVAGDAN